MNMYILIFLLLFSQNIFSEEIETINIDKARIDKVFYNQRILRYDDVKGVETALQECNDLPGVADPFTLTLDNKSFCTTDETYSSTTGSKIYCNSYKSSKTIFINSLEINHINGSPVFIKTCSYSNNFFKNYVSNFLYMLDIKNIGKQYQQCLVQKICKKKGECKSIYGRQEIFPKVILRVGASSGYVYKYEGKKILGKCEVK